MLYLKFLYEDLIIEKPLEYTIKTIFIKSILY